MPNWCFNELTVSSDNEEQLRDFIEKVKNIENGTDLSLNTLVPFPDNFNKIDIEYPNDPVGKMAAANIMADGGKEYAWLFVNWGTRCDVDAELIDYDENYASYRFNSDPAPPIPWITKVALMFPDLNFLLKYDVPTIDPVTAFMGAYSAHNTEVTHKYIQY